jgi:hypothetical protein
MTVATEQKACQPVPYVYRGIGPLPPLASFEALQLLADWRREAAVYELDGAITVLGEQLTLSRQSILRGHSKDLDLVQDLICRRNIYYQRRGTLSQLLGLTAFEVPDETVQDSLRLLSLESRSGLLLDDISNMVQVKTRELAGVEAEIESVAVIAQADQHYSTQGNDPIGPWLQQQIEQAGGALRRLRRFLLPKLAEAASIEIGNLVFEAESLAVLFNSRRNEIRRYRWQQDSVIEWLDGILSRRQQITDLLTLLNADKARLHALVAERVQAAVTEAGRKNVVIAIISSLALAGAESASQLAQELDQCESELRRLTGAGIKSGPAWDALDAKQTQLRNAAAQQKEDVVKRKARAAESLLKSALAGTESARAEMEQLCRTVPAAWPAGFADAIADARADRALLAELS